MILRKCNVCGRILPLTEFAPKTNKCKTCRRDYDWQYRYGLSPEQYFELFQQQEGKCKICGKELPAGKYLSVDHNKETGEIRGLLCPQCNTLLGMANDNTEILEAAIQYLMEDKKNE